VPLVAVWVLPGGYTSRILFTLFILLISLSEVRELLIALGVLKHSAPRAPKPPPPPRFKPEKPWHKIDSTHKPATPQRNEVVDAKPYACATVVEKGKYWDGRVGGSLERLQKFGLPTFTTPEELAQWLNLPLTKLAWLADYHGHNAGEKVKKKQHYHYVWIKKRSGGERLLEAPKPLLKALQKRILRDILNKVPPHPSAHAYTPKKSIRSNAQPHCGKYIVIKADLASFFPSITTKRVAAIFRGLGYNVEISHWLARLCTNIVPYDIMKKERFDTFLTYRHAPQGAPTSPALANLAAWGMDCRLAGLAKKWSMTYTRYADDLTFSADEAAIKGKSLNWFVKYLRGIVRDEKFGWNKEKLKIVRRGGRQFVTGLTVNVKPNIGRKEYDTLKAILHNCVKHGLASQNREKIANFRAHLEGRVSFVTSVNPARGQKLQAILNKVDR